MGRKSLTPACPQHPRYVTCWCASKLANSKTPFPTLHDNLVNLSWKPHSQETPSAEPSQQEEGKGVLRDRGPDPLDKGWRPQMEKKLLLPLLSSHPQGYPCVSGLPIQSSTSQELWRHKKNLKIHRVFPSKIFKLKPVMDLGFSQMF